MKYTLGRTLALLVFWVLFAQAAVAANDKMALQGTVNISGTGNISVTIWDSPAAGNLVYDSGQDFNGQIRSGRYDILLGSGASVLNLEYGRTYYLDMSINSQDLDFNGSERQEFQSSVGTVSSTYIEDGTISSLQILDESLSGIDIANDSIQKNKIESAGTWIESEIPSLTSSWSGTLDASRIISPLLLNVNNSLYLGGYAASYFTSSDTSLSQRIDAGNTSVNIKKLGFNTTAELDTRYAQTVGNSGNSTSEIVEAVNKTAGTYSISVLWANIVNRITKLSDLTQDMNYINITDNQTLTNAINTKLSVGSANQVTVDFTNNVTGKPANLDTDSTNDLTTSDNATLMHIGDNSTLWNAINNRLINGTGISQLSNDANYLTNATMNKSISCANIIGGSDGDYCADATGSGGDGTGNAYNLTDFTNISSVQGLNYTTLNGRYVAVGTKLGNTTAEIQAAEADTKALAYLASALNSTDQRYNDSLINSTGNIKKLGFNATTELDTRYSQIGTGGDGTGNAYNATDFTNVSSVQGLNYTTLNGKYVAAGTKLGNTTSEIQAAEADTKALSYLASALNATDQRYNDTLINTTANIKKLGFNTTAELDTRYSQIGADGDGTGNAYNLTDFTNISSVQGLNYTTLNGRYVAVGTKLGNTTAEIQAAEADTKALAYLASALNSTDQRYNDSLINSTGNIKKLGFNATTELDTRYSQIGTGGDGTGNAYNTTDFTNISGVQGLSYTTLNGRYVTNGTKLGNSTSEINAVESDPVVLPKLATYANQTYVQDSNTSIWSAINNRILTSTVQTLLSTYANQTYVQDSNTSLWTSVNLKETKSNVQSLLSTYANQTYVQDSNTTLWTAMNLKATISNVQSLLSTYENYSATQSLLSTYANQTYVQDSNTTIWSAVNSRILTSTVQTLLSTYSNQTYVQDSNTTLWTAVNLKETKVNVQSLLSTYANQSYVQDSNSTIWSAFIDTNRSIKTSINNLITTNSTQVVHIGDANQVTVDYAKNITNNPVTYEYVPYNYLPKKDNTYKEITELRATVIANYSYMAEYTIVYSSNDTLDGLSLGVSSPPTVINVSRMIIGGAAAAGTDSNFDYPLFKFNQTVTVMSTATLAANTMYIATITSTFYPLATGELKVYYASEVANGNITIYRGTNLRLTNLNMTV